MGQQLYPPGLPQPTDVCTKCSVHVLPDSPCEPLRLPGLACMMNPNEALSCSLEELQAVRVERAKNLLLLSIPVCLLNAYQVRGLGESHDAPTKRRQLLAHWGRAVSLIRRAHFCSKSFRASQEFLDFIFVPLETHGLFRDAYSGIFKVVVASLGCLYIFLFTPSLRLKRGQVFFFFSTWGHCWTKAVFASLLIPW